MSGNEIFAQVRDFQQFLRPRELETAPAIDLKPPILRADPDGARAPRRQEPRLGRAGEAPPVRMPGNRVTQIVLNLLLNAADALGDRPWNANQVEVRLSTVEHWAVIEVKDNGPGHRRRDPPAPVRAGRQRQARRTQSLGLGLAICRELARAAGGEISVSSPLTGSTLFRVALPPAGLRQSRQRPEKIVDERAGSGRTRSSFPCHQA